MFVLMIYMIIRILILQKRNRENQGMIKVLDLIHDEDAFYPACDAYIAKEKSQEFVTKMQVLRLWADTRYEHDEDFHKDLESIDLNKLVKDDKGNTKKKDALLLDEDSFFYLYLAIPNRLYYRKNEKLREELDKKLDSWKDLTGDLLIKKIHEAATAFYDNTGDKGKAFFQQVMDGDYGQYDYSKQLIGLYKHCIEGFLAVLAKEEGTLDQFYQENLEDLKQFKNTNLGSRWLEELSVELPVEEKEEKNDPSQYDAAPAEEKNPEEKKEDKE